MLMYEMSVIGKENKPFIADGVFQQDIDAISFVMACFCSPTMPC